MALRKSGEDYLETIYILKQKQGKVRSVDVADYMDYSKPSVSRAVKNLREGGFLKMLDGGELQLTEKGLTKAKEIYERHVVLTDWFVSLGVTPEVAADDACNIEHVISDETFNKIKALYYQKMERLGEEPATIYDIRRRGGNKQNSDEE